ncbi:MAG: DVUA0089 family protein [Planctomycetota bacterium]
MAALAVCAGLGHASTASFTADLGTVAASRFSVVTIDTSALDANTDYVAYRVSADWSLVLRQASSDFTSIVFGDPETGDPISEPTFAINGRDDLDPVENLTFVGEFDASPSEFFEVDFAVTSNIFRAFIELADIRVEWFTPDDLTVTGVLDPGVLAPNAPTSNVIDLGVVGEEGDTPTFDTFGSGFDTELALFAADGRLIDSNDDSGDDFQSRVYGHEIVFDDEGTPSRLGLAAGQYFLALGEFDSEFGDGFSAAGDTISSRDDPYLLNLNGELVSSGRFAFPTDIQYFSFTIVPAPGVGGVLVVGVGCGAGRRRR